MLDTEGVSYAVIKCTVQEDYKIPACFSKYSCSTPNTSDNKNKSYHISQIQQGLSGTMPAQPAASTSLCKMPNWRGWKTLGTGSYVYQANRDQLTLFQITKDEQDVGK